MEVILDWIEDQKMSGPFDPYMYYNLDDLGIVWLLSIFVSKLVYLLDRPIKSRVSKVYPYSYHHFPEKILETSNKKLLDGFLETFQLFSHQISKLIS